MQAYYVVSARYCQHYCHSRYYCLALILIISVLSNWVLFFNNNIEYHPIPSWTTYRDISYIAVYNLKVRMCMIIYIQNAVLSVNSGELNTFLHGKTCSTVWLTWNCNYGNWKPLLIHRLYTCTHTHYTVHSPARWKRSFICF